MWSHKARTWGYIVWPWLEVNYHSLQIENKPIIGKHRGNKIKVRVIKSGKDEISSKTIETALQVIYILMIEALRLIMACDCDVFILQLGLIGVP